MNLREHNELDEAFTTVLMKEHGHDWDMETVREAALICSNLAISDRKQHELEARIDELDGLEQFYVKDDDYAIYPAIEKRITELKAELKKTRL